MRLLGWHLEEAGIKLGYVIAKEIPILCNQGLRGARVRVVKGFSVPPVGGYGAPARAPVQQQAFEFLGAAGAGEATAHADDGDWGRDRHDG